MVNQIGTLTETYDAVGMAKRAGYNAVFLTVPADTRTASWNPEYFRF